ncbi:MAG TPA: dTDP-4-dehydrorhamnose reductase [Dongiaceae bacterium]|nr:dTDP-4-dehydrorhamnose reductase [Dongiaceae bacterium]
MRILVLGARGMLGRDLLDEWSSEKSDQVIPAGSAEADLREFDQVRALVEKARPEWIIVSAAYTDVDGCERNPELAFAVNGTGVGNVARAAQSTGSRVLLVSTDYVFDGQGTRPYEINDPIAPLSVYGKSKAAGEAALQADAPQGWVIARTSWLFGVHGPSFPAKILQAADSRPELSVVNDQIGSPTYTRDLARAIRQLVQKGAHGIFHVTDEGVCSWFDFAREILALSGRSNPVLPITTDQSARPARRPAYSVLSPASLHAVGIRTRPWQEALRAFLAEKSAPAALSERR